MLDIYFACAAFFHICIDVRKPTFNAREILNFFSHHREVFPGNFDGLVFIEFLHHQPHIHQHRVGAGGNSFLMHLLPKCRGLDADFRQHRILLHGLWRERAIKIIDDGNRVLKKFVFRGAHGFAGGDFIGGRSFCHVESLPAKDGKDFVQTKRADLPHALFSKSVFVV